MRRRVAGWTGAALAASLVLVSAATAEPASKTDLEPVIASRWDGGGTNARLGKSSASQRASLNDLGDINGDGRDDLGVTTSGGSAAVGTYVLFTRASGVTKLTYPLSPEVGYRVGAGGSQASIVGIGDQNGDGIPDTLVSDGPDEDTQLAVVYGVRDPSKLATPIDIAHLTAAQGYRIQSGYDADDVDDNDAQTNFGYNVADLGDVDGDGIDDIGITAYSQGTFGGRVYVLYGGRSATPVTSLAALPASEGFKVEGEEASGLGTPLTGLGDLDGDGRDEFAAYEATTGKVRVIAGGARGAGDVDAATLGPARGFTIEGPPSAALGGIASLGDVNGDGRPDLAIGRAALTGGLPLAVVYGPTRPWPSAPIAVPATDIDPAVGYTITDAESGAFFAASAGDLDGDGVDDLAIANPGLLSGTSVVGGVELVLGPRPLGPLGPVSLGPALTADRGIALLGAAGAATGTAVAAGDVDGDGLRDFFVSAPNAKRDGFTNSGSIFVVRGASLFAKGVTSPAADLATTGATLSGVVSAHGRPVTVSFEYGTTATYGTRTPPVAQGARTWAAPVETAVTALAPGTTYHYRVVVTNDLGVSAHGHDRTFTTPQPVGPGGGTTTVERTVDRVVDRSVATPPERIDVTLGAVAARVRRGAKLSLTVRTTVQRAQLGSVAVLLDGKALKTVTTPSSTVVVPASRLAKVGPHRLTAVAVTRSGAARSTAATAFVVYEAKKAKKAAKKAKRQSAKRRATRGPVAGR